MPKATEATLRALIARCRTALAWEPEQWEEDVGTAVERDAQLVRDIDSMDQDSASQM